MYTLPGANTTVSDAAGAVASGTDTICILAPVPVSADAVPRLFGSASALLDQHGYSEGAEYAAFHVQETGRPFIFVGLPIATAGAISRENTGGNTGTSVTTLTAGASGVLTEHEGQLKVKRGGTVGTSQIVLSYSCDGGRSWKDYRLGTAVSFTIPRVGVSVALAVGTLVAGDVIHTWHGSGPRSDASGWSAARTALASQMKFFRSALLIGDLQDSAEAAAFTDEIDAYKTSNDRDIYARASVPDRLPLAAMSKTIVRMGAASVTFAEVGGTGDTITRSPGGFITDGFTVGDYFEVTGSASNNVSGVLAGVSETVLTLGTTDLVAEGPVANVAIIASPALVFSSSAHTITRNRGSWLTDDFRVGDSVTITGTASNNVTATITAVTATVMTFASGLADETIGSRSVTIVAGQTKAAWMAATEAAFASIDGRWRIDLSAGRACKSSPLTQWQIRRPPSWAASLREYQHDLHTTTWRKSDGVTGWDLFDASGQLVEWDDRVDGEAGVAARFTVFRTYPNGPVGSFIAMSLTRATEGSLLGHTSNVAVCNLALQVCQSAAENQVGRSPILLATGRATPEELSAIKAEVNSALELALLTNQKGEGPRLSSADWEPASDDILNVAQPVLNGVMTLNFRGIIHTVNTTTKILSGGQS